MSVAAFLADLERRDVRVRLDESGLVVDAPSGALTAEDRVALSTRKALVVAWLQALGRRAAPVRLSAAWPREGSWQHAYATTGRHPLRCDRCGARTLRTLGNGRVGCPPCESDQPAGSLT